MLEDHCPTVRVFIGISNISLAQLQHVVPGIPGFWRVHGHSLMQAIECPCIDIQDDIIDVLKDQVQGFPRYSLLQVATLRALRPS